MVNPPLPGSGLGEGTVLRALLENSSDVITLLDADGGILYQSPSVKRILGYEQGELVGTNAFARVHPDDVEAAREVFRRRVNDESLPDRIRYRFRHRDGSWRLLEATGRNRLDDPAVGGLVVNSHDVTDRIEAEDALQRSERYFRSLFEKAADVVTILDGGGVIRYESPSAERVVGWRTDELVGHNMFEFVHPDDVPRLMGTFQEVLQNPGVVYAYEFRFRHRDGSWRVLDGLGRNLLHDSAVEGIVANSRDITDRKRAEDELVRAKEASEAASRAKSDFLSSMSHELRTPLNSVIGFTNVLLRNRAGNQREQDLEYLGRIVANGKHLLGLIDDVLDLSKIEAGKMGLHLSPVGVDGLVLETLAELKGAVRDRPLELRVSAPDAVAAVDADAGRLKQVLINLVGNAVKFTERGHVSVTVTTDPATHRPLRIDVADTGPGIAPDRLQAIFQAFEQGETGTARRYGGTGLGLAISSKLAALMGYRLVAESVEGEGSTFGLLLDPEACDAAESGEPAAPAAPGGDRGPLVLVVDDERDSRMLLGLHLEELGCRTIAAASGEQALRMAREFRPDLVTLDLLLPGMSGWEILRALKTDPELSDIPVVVVSVVAGENRGNVIGAVDLLEKPVERADLQAVIRRHLRPEGLARALVVDADPAARDLVASYLDEAGVESRRAATGREALEVLDGWHPDVVVLDLSTPAADRLGLLRALQDGSARSRIPVVVLADEHLSRDELDALSRDAAAVLRKDLRLEEALRAVIQRLSARDPAACR